MKSRRQAREAVLQSLYMSDTLNDWSDASQELFFTQFCPIEVSETTPPATELETREFAKKLIAGISHSLTEIDGFIAGASLHWSVARMSRVDRNILRCATYEIAYVPEIPVNVTINEAIEIAKRFGSDDSPMFINGVLDNLGRMFERVDGVVKVQSVSRRKVANG